jgi:hypothetical protein
MANATPSRYGSINNGADGSFANDYALFLKVFGGEVLTTFNEKNVMMPLHVVRTIANGKTAQFPVTGKATAAYHVPGTEITGTAIPGNEVTINIDSQLIAPVFISNVDDAISHYDVRSEYSRLLARALAKQADEQLLRVGVLAARAAATVTGGNAGTVLAAGAGVETTAATLRSAIFNAKLNMDQKDVPEEDRYCILRPAQFKILAEDTTTLNRDWGGTGSLADGKPMMLAGFKLIWSNNLPTQGVVAAVTGENNTYNGTFTNTVALCFQREAIGTVKLRDLVMESQYDIRRQGHLFLAKYQMGHGKLRPECAVEISKA